MRTPLTHLCQFLFSDALRASEQRTLNHIDSSRYAKIAQAGETVEDQDAKRAKPEGSLIEAMDRIEKAAAMEVGSSTATVQGRLLRPFGKLAGAVTGINIYNAGEANVDNTLNRLTRENMGLADEYLGKREADSVKALGKCTRVTKLRSHFLNAKSVACDKIRGQLEEMLRDASSRLENANTLKTADRGELKKSVARLQKRLQSLGRVAADTQANLKASSSGALEERVRQTGEYFTKSFAGYSAEDAAGVQEMLQEFASGNRTKLELAIGRAAIKMYRANAVQQERQRKAMLKVANDMIVKRTFWSQIKWGLKDIGTVGIYSLYNLWKLGTTDKTAFLQGELKDVFRTQAAKQLEGMRKAKSMKSVTERMSFIKSLPAGATFNVEHGGKTVPVSVLRNAGDVCVAGEKNPPVKGEGITFCLDLIGQEPHQPAAPGEEKPEPNFATVIKKPRVRDQYGQAVMNRAPTDGIVTIAAAA